MASFEDTVNNNLFYIIKNNQNMDDNIRTSDEIKTEPVITLFPIKTETLIKSENTGMRNVDLDTFDLNSPEYKYMTLQVIKQLNFYSKLLSPKRKPKKIRIHFKPVTRSNIKVKNVIGIKPVTRSNIKVTSDIKPELVEGIKYYICETCGRKNLKLYKHLEHCNNHKNMQSDCKLKKRFRYKCEYCRAEFTGCRARDEHENLHY
jgi:hypothetical protein